MFVCLCHGVTEKKVKDLIDQGLTSTKEVKIRCKAGSTCGACLESITELIEKQSQKKHSHTPAKNKASTSQE